jgi:sorbitol/mannitol transport system permease protein
MFTRAAVQTVGRDRLRWTTLFMTSPSLFLLFVWMAAPLVMTFYFSIEHYNLMSTNRTRFVGFENYLYLLRAPGFPDAVRNSLIILVSVVGVTITGGTLLAWLCEEDFPGCRIARLLIIAPFFVMPTVSALLWKNLMLHPIYGLMAFPMRAIGFGPIDWFGRMPMLAIVLILSWEWLPFAFLILLTSVQSFNRELKEAAIIDGARPWEIFRHLIVPHLKRAISVVIMIEAIFLLSTFAEVLLTTSGGPGTATTNLTYLIYSLGLLQFDVGMASAGGMVAVVLANVAAFFLIQTVAREFRSTQAVQM